MGRININYWTNMVVEFYFKGCSVKAAISIVKQMIEGGKHYEQ